MKFPRRPGGRKARRKVKASSLKNIREKGCGPRKALPRKKLTRWKADVRRFLKRIPIGGSKPTGPRTANWQDKGTNYITGLLLPGRRKSMEPISRRIPDEDYQQMQQFITDSTWDSRATMDGLMAFFKNNMAGLEGVIVIDDTGSKKKGKISPGVAKQYFSETKMTGNCQKTMTCVYAEQIGPTNADMITLPLGMQLYLPEEWDEDIVRREKAGIPSDMRFKKDWEVGLDRIEYMKESGIPHKCIIADAEYGRVIKFRAQLRQWKEPYILPCRVDRLNVIPIGTPIIRPGDKGVHGNRKHPFLPEGITPDNSTKIAERARDWKTVRWGKGTKGHLEAKYIRRKVRVCKFRTPTDETGWLIIEKNVEGIKPYICWGLDDLSLEEQVRVIHYRWTIEEYHKEIKDKLGFDHFEGRKYRGWEHHSVLIQMAYALLAWLRWLQRGSDEKMPLPTLPEVRRILIVIIVEMLLLDDRNWTRCKTCPVVTLVREVG